jgi:hypothetical protein
LKKLQGDSIDVSIEIEIRYCVLGSLEGISFKIDELKLEVSIAEEEAEQYEARNREAEVLWVWMGENHPDILTTFNVLQRLEDSHEI